MEALRVARGWGSHIFRHSTYRWWQGCQPYAPAAFLPPGRFLVLIFVRGWVDPRAIVQLEGLGKLKKSTSSGTWTGDLLACSIVPQPTTLPRALSLRYILMTSLHVSIMLADGFFPWVLPVNICINLSHTYMFPWHKRCVWCYSSARLRHSWSG
jgi:hypothetical protein